MTSNTGLTASYKHREPIGIEVRFSHEECGDSRERLYVKRTVKGYIYHCHNCGYKGFSRADSMSPEETLKCLTEPVKPYTEVKDVQLQLPYDFIEEVPPAGKIWCYKYGITDQELEDYRFGSYSNGSRLLLPVYDTSDRLVYYQGRNLGTISKANPKYLNVRASGAKNVFFRSITQSNPTSNSTIHGSGNCGCVLVEDILSAIKVGRICDSIALLGSYIPPSINDLLLPYTKVYIWLDPDKRQEALKYSQMLQALGTNATPIFSELDPKEHTNPEIKETLLP